MVGTASASRDRRVVVVTRSTEYEDLLRRHATRGQARFFLETRGQKLEELEERHEILEGARRLIEEAIPSTWRRAKVRRARLDRFLFEPDDLVAVVGQDGLVANVSKYLKGQPVIGFNPEPAVNEGVLVRWSPDEASQVLAEVDGLPVEERSMVKATLDDGQILLALNEIFVGHSRHQSARYEIRSGGETERQSSSGVIVATGTGSTGWAKSIHQQCGSCISLPRPSDASLSFFVREAFSSRATGTRLVEGLLKDRAGLELVSRMNEGGVVFGDGIEDDFLPLGWGRRVEVGLARRRLRVVVH